MYHTVNINSEISLLPLCFELCLFKASSLEVTTKGAQHFLACHSSCQYLYEGKTLAMKSFTCRRDKLLPAECALLPSLSLVSSLPVPLTTAHPYLFGPHLTSHAIMKYCCQKQKKPPPCICLVRYGPEQVSFEINLKAVKAAVMSSCFNCCSFDYDRLNCNVLKQAHSYSDSAVVLAHILLTCS